MKDRRCVDDLTIEELEQALYIKKFQARQERIRRLARDGRLVQVNPLIAGQGEGMRPAPQPAAGVSRQPRSAQVHPLDEKTPPTRQRKFSKVRDGVLLVIEVAALAALLFVLAGSLLNLKELNQEVTLAREIAQATPTPTPLIQMARLPGGHSPPTAPDGAIPEHLQGLVQPAPAMPIPTPGPQSPTRLVIPAITVDVPVLEGVDWEMLKKGVGHLPGSANPGERGNLYIAGHNDIYGEVFRYLDKLKIGDEFIVYAGEKPYRYSIEATKVVEADDVSVMLPTTEPIATLQTCYPYLVDTHRLVVIARLAE
jgi:sortase A